MSGRSFTLQQMKVGELLDIYVSTYVCTDARTDVGTYRYRHTDIHILKDLDGHASRNGCCTTFCNPLGHTTMFGVSGAPVQVWCFSAVRIGSEKQKVAVDGLLDMLLLPVTEPQV